MNTYEDIKKCTRNITKAEKKAIYEDLVSLGSDYYLESRLRYIDANLNYMACNRYDIYYLKMITSFIYVLENYRYHKSKNYYIEKLEEVYNNNLKIENNKAIALKNRKRHKKPIQLKLFEAIKVNLNKLINR